MNEPPLDLADIQGNILAGFNTDFQVLIGLKAQDGRFSDIGTWLAAQAPNVTSVAEIREQRQSMRRPSLAAPETWLCLSLSIALLGALRSDVVFRDEGIVGGFGRRARGALGDRTDPATWLVGGPSAAVDVFLILASNVAAAAETRADEMVAGASAAGLEQIYRETGCRIGDREHFGFRDGISQPKVRGFDQGGAVGAGYFVFGYEREPGSGPYIPAIDPNNYVPNGSFLVFRRLEQDVTAFRQFCADAVTELQVVWPGLTAPHLAAILVGRWPSGALASVTVPIDPGRQPDENEFDFTDDASGRSCPFGAHIRKVNPREGPKDLVVVPRLLRRGIPFGRPLEDAPGEGRGLAFLSFQTSIRNQLELLTGQWMNSPLRPASAAGHDLLVGRSAGNRSLTIQGPNGPVMISDGGSQWVTPTGGAYLFTPSKSALARITGPAARAGWWQARKLLALAGDSVRQSLGFDGLEH